MLHLIPFHRIPAPLHRAILPLGHALRRGWLRLARPRIAGVCVLIEDGKGRVLLVRHSYGQRGWTVPAGGMTRDEDPEAAARREMREELGCELSALTLLHQGEEMLHGAGHTFCVFHARALSEPVPDGREVIAIGWFAPDALPDEIGALAVRRLALLQQR